MTRPMTETLSFFNNDWILPLDGYDFSDYPHNTLDIGFRNNTAYFVPLIVEWQVLYYRKDLLQAAGIDVPSTFEELEAAAGHHRDFKALRHKRPPKSTICSEKTVNTALPDRITLK